MKEEIDITEDAPKVGDVSKVTEKARELYRQESKLDQLNDEAKKIKEKVTFISDHELPQMMDEEGVSQLTLSNGYVLDLKDIYNASIPTQPYIDKLKDELDREEYQDRREEGLSWLIDNGADSLIKNVVIIDIPKDEEAQKKIDKLMEFASELGLIGKTDKTVNNRTLTAFVKEEMEKEDGLEIPEKTFGVFVGTKAILKKPKTASKAKAK